RGVDPALPSRVAPSAGGLPRALLVRHRARLDRPGLLGLHREPASGRDLRLRDRLRDVRLPLAGAVPPRARDALGRPAVAPSALRSLRRGAGAAGRRGVLRRLRAGGVRARAAGARRAADALAMAALTAVGLVALCFGVGAYYTAEGLGVFAAVNLLAGA